MSNVIELRAVVRDEQQPAQVRREAAALLIKQLAEQAAQEPVQSDDPEVVKLITPPREDTETHRFIADLMRRCGYTTPTLAEAKAKVQERHKLRSVLAVVVDESASQIERLAACTWVLQEHPHFDSWKVNGYSPERLLDKVLPPGAIKWTSKGQETAKRPPETLRDVWS